MVASVSSSTSGVSNWTDSVFSKLDAKKQGYIDKSDLASALSATGQSDGSGDSSTVDDMFGAIDGDSDGKVTKSELSEAVSKLSDQLNAQFDASRVQGGMPPGPPPGGAPSDETATAPDDGSVGAAGAAGAAGGMAPAGAMQGAGGPRGGGAGGAGASESTGSTDATSTSTDYVAAADTDGDGTVSDAEQAAYDKKVASGEIDKNGKGTERATDSGSGPAREKDPARELAHALQMLKAYADNSGDADASAASTAGVSVDA